MHISLLSVVTQHFNARRALTFNCGDHMIPMLMDRYSDIVRQYSMLHFSVAVEGWSRRTAADEITDKTSTHTRITILRKHGVMSRHILHLRHNSPARLWRDYSVHARVGIVAQASRLRTEASRCCQGRSLRCAAAIVSRSAVNRLDRTHTFVHVPQACLQLGTIHKITGGWTINRI